MSRAPLLLSTVAATTLLAAAALGSCTASTPAGSDVTVPSSISVATSTAAAPAGSRGTAAAPGTAADTARVEALQRLVAARFDAVTRGDRAAWLGALDAAVPEPEVARQGRIFDRMRAMRVTDLHVVSVSAVDDPALTTTASTATPTGPGEGGVARRARVSATYRLDGFDTTARAFALDLLVADDPASESPGTIDTHLLSSTPHERPQPWDLEGLRVQRSAAALLLVAGSADRVSELSRRARVAAERVAAVWGHAEPAVWLAPASDADAARLLGRSASAMAAVAAVTDGPLEPGERAGADRVVIVPEAWESLSGVGRDVVLTHELTHATVRASTTRPVPAWLAEGLAELVAYRPLRLPERAVVAPALEEVHRDGVPRSLPADADFDPASGRIDAAYGLALLAARTIAERHGTAGLVRLYRAAAGGIAVPASALGDAEATTDLSLERVLATDRATLTARWRARIAQE